MRYNEIGLYDILRISHKYIIPFHDINFMRNLFVLGDTFVPINKAVLRYEALVSHRVIPQALLNLVCHRFHQRRGSSAKETVSQTSARPHEDRVSRRA